MITGTMGYPIFRQIHAVDSQHRSYKDHHMKEVGSTQRRIQAALEAPLLYIPILWQASNLVE